MKVTAVKEDKNNIKNIFIDGQFAFVLHNSVVSKTGIKKDDEITEEEVEKVFKKEEFKKAVDYAELLLSYRPRSIYEIESKLNEKKYDRDIRERVIKNLKEEGYLDDKKFASWWIRQRRTGRPKGDIAIKSELKSKGLLDSVIEEAFCEENEKRRSSEFELAWEACKSRLDGYRDLPEKKAARRLSALLKRRGFKFETIRKVLDKFFKG